MSARPPAAELESLAREVKACRACPLWQDATQAVPGEGSTGASMMLVGEQPGDREDLAGHPFVGPAGGVLDRALEIAGIPRASVFLTNGVKHFKYRMRGKRRIHQRPAAGEIKACRPWLEAEIGLVGPAVIVALGASAVYALTGRTMPVGENRGRVIESPLFATPLLITAHPSSVLRERDDDARHAALDALAADLSLAHRVG